MSERAREERIDFVLRGMSLPDRLRLNATYRDASWNCIVDPFLLEYAADEIERLQQSPSLHREPIEADREAAERIAAIIKEQMREWWDDICSDTGCHPLDFERRGKALWYDARHWTEAVAKYSAEAIVAHRLAFSTPAASDVAQMREACAKVAKDFAAAIATQKTHPDPLPIDTNEGWRRVEDAALDIADAIAALPLPKVGETETAFEIWEDDLMVASASTEAEGLHYFAVYSQDGPVKLVRVETVRQVIATPSTEGRKREDQA